MFAAMGLEWEEAAINLKCDPEYAIELRDRYPEIIPGYHMNKKHWNTVYAERGLEDELIMELIDHSFNLVIAKLPRASRDELKDADN